MLPRIRALLVYAGNRKKRAVMRRVFVNRVIHGASGAGTAVLALQAMEGSCRSSL